MEIAELANRLIASVLVAWTPDPEIYAPGATHWHNKDLIDRAWDHTAPNRAAIKSRIPDIGVSDTVVRTWEEGFLVQYVVTGSDHNGTFSIPGCFVVTVADGLISRIEEYMDSAQLTPMQNAIADARVS